MSVILEALRKAERERQRGHVPTISASHGPVGRRQRRRKWLIFLVLGANLTLLGLLAWSGATPAGLLASAGMSASDEPPEPAAQSSPSTPINVARAERAKSVGASERRNNVLPNLKPRVRAAPRAAELEGASDGRDRSPLRRAALDVRGSDPAIGAQGRLEARPSRSPADAAGAPPARTPSPPGPDALPMLWQLPATIAQTMPDLQVTMHVYSPDAAHRFVRLNGGKYRERDQIAQDLVLEAVTEQGAIMNYRGTRFRLER